MIVGVLHGIIDFYFSAALQRQSAKVYSKVGISMCETQLSTVSCQDDLVLGKKLGGGGFGLVYKAELIKEDGESVEAVVKKVMH